MFRPKFWIFAWTFVFLTSAAWAGDYNHDIRPILAEHCFNCHGPDSASRKGGLRLDQREAAIKMEAIVPGKPGESELVTRIFTENQRKVMPPPSTNKKLTPGQKEILKRWVAGGADYQAHWSYLPPQRPTLPAVKNKAWVRNAIDYFILEKLEAKGLQPAAEADKRTLARRLSLDLTGLPPTPAEVEQFVNDPAPDAYERYVDRLMQAPHWGEHRARYWLDAARYADSHGLHFDNYREIWPFRDWVIGAFNRNLPFDQFTVEQLAGDLLPNPTLEQQVASGFHRCNITTNEGGTIPEENLAIYAKDRVETTATVWLGLTANCASCHEHKFDSIPLKEFYQMAAFFRNTTQGAMDGNIPNSPPVLVVPAVQDSPRWFALLKNIVQLREDLDSRRKSNAQALVAWLKSGGAKELTEPLDPKAQVLSLPLQEGQGTYTTVTINNDTKKLYLPSSVAWGNGPTPENPALHFKGTGSMVVPGLEDLDADQPFSLGGWVYVPKGNSLVASKIDKNTSGWKLNIRGNRVVFTLTGQDKSQLILDPKEVRLAPERWTHLCVTYDGSRENTGLILYVNGKAYYPDQGGVVEIQGSIKNNAPLRFGSNGTEHFKEGALHDFRVYRRTLAADEVTVLWKWENLKRGLAKNPAAPPPALLNDLNLFYAVRFDPDYPQLTEKLTKMEREQQEIKRRGAITHVMQERPDTMPTARVLFRGQYDQPRDEVKPAVFSMLHPMPKGAPQNRLGLAQWIIAPDNPLTARVTVNRFWQEVFGTGIVRTTGDLGVSGEMPSHPELLDWLAVEFMSPSPRPSPQGGEGENKGWDIKKFFKLLVTSATYRQQAVATKNRLEKDPANTYLSRGPRFRMDAEMIRDYALATSGLLVRKIGGPSVKPYQPEGVWESVAMIGSNTRDYRQDKGENLYRRSMYTFWKRGAPPASMDIFNASSREFCTVRRERTNTPLQALVTLNDPQFIEAARFLAQTTLKEGGEKTEGRFDFLAKRLLARPFRGEEVRVVQASLDELLKYYRANPQDAQKLLAVGEARPDPGMDGPTLAAWTMLTNELMNLDEVLNK